MRKLEYMLRGILGAAAMMTVTSTMMGCEDEAIRVVVPMAAAKTAPSPTPVVASPAPVASPSPVVTEVVADEEVSDIDAARDALKLGELDRALKLARMAVKKEPNKSSAWNTLGRVALRRGQHKDATSAFQRAIAANPKSSFAHNNLGLVYLYDGKYDEAVSELEQAVENTPVEGYMWNNLGMAYEHLDLLDDARDAYRNAVAQKVVRAKRNLARLEGVTSIRTAHLDIDPDAEDVVLDAEQGL